MPPVATTVCWIGLTITDHQPWSASRIPAILTVTGPLIQGRGFNPSRWCMDRDRERAIILRRKVARFLDRMASHKRHHIACGIMSFDDTLTLGINIASNLGPASVCAEQVALGEALKSPESLPQLVVTLRATFQPGEPPEIVPPCGRCRELLYQYAPRAKTMIPKNDSGGIDPSAFELIKVVDLLPFPFVRRDR
jgi:cytidine deaminase